MSTSPQLFAHRGLHHPFSPHPESSFDSYRAAIDAGADGVECDIRLTQDGHLVVWHDATLERIAQSPLRISRSTLDQLREVWPILTLEELLDLTIAERKNIAIETKHPVRFGQRVERDLSKLLKRKHAAIKASGIDIYLMSFSWWATSYNAQAPYMATYLVRSRRLMFLARFLTAGLNIEILRSGFIPSDPSTTLVWTVNDEADIKLCKSLGVHVIITDDLRLAQSA